MSNPSSTSHLSYPSLDFNTDPNIDYSDPFGLGVSGGMNTGCNLIVNYLPHDFEDHDLQALFSKYGEIMMIKVIKDKNSKKSLGYGFVKFFNVNDAYKAIEALNGFNIGNKQLKVSIARPPSLDIRNCKLYVSNLPKSYTESDIIALFQNFGEIIECRVLVDHATNESKGVAFVLFNLKSQAYDALKLNGKFIDNEKALVVKFAEDQHRKKKMTFLNSTTMPNFPIHDVNVPGGGPLFFPYPHAIPPQMNPIPAPFGPSNPPPMIPGNQFIPPMNTPMNTSPTFDGKHPAVPPPGWMPPNLMPGQIPYLSAGSPRLYDFNTPFPGPHANSPSGSNPSSSVHPHPLPISHLQGPPNGGPNIPSPHSFPFPNPNVNQNPNMPPPFLSNNNGPVNPNNTNPNNN